VVPPQTQTSSRLAMKLGVSVKLANCVAIKPQESGT